VPQAARQPAGATHSQKRGERVSRVVSETYVLEIKPSARRHSSRAGEWVHERGPRRVFDSKALAREWANQRGTQVWIQDAAPHDASAVDGYLVGGRRASGARRSDQQTSL
jgi:hypothetical protein